MKGIKGRSNCYFTHSVIADLVFVLMGIFDKKNPIVNEDIYADDYIGSIREDYRFLGEIISSLPSNGFEMLEFLLLNDNFNDIEEYKKYILDFSDDKFFFYFYGQFIDMNLIQSALKDGRNLNRLYSSFEYISTSFLALSSLFNNKDIFLSEFFSCLERLNNKAFNDKYNEFLPAVNSEFSKIEGSLSELDPLEFSQRIMGKTFKNRGPYERFIYIPSYFLNHRAVRFFWKHQILIYSINNSRHKRDNLTKVLKVISDDKRFEILELLSGNEPLMGKDLADRLELTKATVSHHIEQLKEIGFINEERVKNSKFYSVNSNAVEKFLKDFSSKLKKS